jgi:nucleoside-diphosphate-sugar epimerase
MIPTQIFSRHDILKTSITRVLPNLELAGLHKQRIFITGGTGFFGLWLLTALQQLHVQGIQLQVCVLSRNPQLFLTIHPQFLNQSWLKFISGDITNFDIPKEQFDLLLHAATETSMEAHAAPLKMFDSIVIGTRRVLELARLAGVRRVLLISSGAVYGPQLQNQTHQLDESQTACNPLLATNAYGEGKRTMELMGAIMQSETGVESLSARCFAFCGPGLPLAGHFAIGNFIRDALYAEEIIVKGDGEQRRSYLYGADLAVWLLYLLINGKAGQSYNVGNDEAISIRELAFTIRDVLAPNCPVVFLKQHDSMSSTRNYYVPSIKRARELGCKPWTSLSDAIELSAAYHKAVL